MAKKKLLIAAVVVGLMASALMFLWAQQYKSQQEQKRGRLVRVVKASQQLAPGTILSPNHIAVGEVEEQGLSSNVVMESEAELYLGAEVGAEGIGANKVLTSRDFATTQTARELASNIPEGERAFSISVDMVTGVSGLLNPGDTVDILGTFPLSGKDEVIPDGAGGGATGYATLALLQNVTLLAVGQRISGGIQGGRSRSYSTVTLSVTLEEAEMLTIAQTRGKLNLLLRKRDDIELAESKMTKLIDLLKNLDLLQEKKVIRVKKIRKRKKKVEKKKDLFDYGNQSK